MISDLRIYVVIGLFMVICISLLIFNFAVIRYARSKYARATNKIDKWKKILYMQAVMPDGAGVTASKHERLLLKKLVKPERLIAYAQALKHLKHEFPEAYTQYACRSFDTFRKLAVLYGRKPHIERTCYADFIGTFPEMAGDTCGELIDALIAYIDNENFHCRVKVFRALCNIGTIHGVVNVLQLFHDRSLFIHHQLLTNGLLHFNGDQEVLAKYLWDESRNWNDNLTVAVIRFITRISNRYNEAFLPVLRDASTHTEVCIAIVHYYKEYLYEPVIPVLVEFTITPIDKDLAVEAKSTLALYPTLEVAAATTAATNASAHPPSDFKMQSTPSPKQTNAHE